MTLPVSPFSEPFWGQNGAEIEHKYLFRRRSVHYSKRRFQVILDFTEKTTLIYNHENNLIFSAE